ncbi:hypothetical protein QF042_001729 [Pedobacter sp. W3I1]|uniref:hypothetical protein n=1 Tax=Pedobacter sp. W3I1 TaxID=3042291 RepID=UPI002786C62A|nr:hypothetical protein [Pedobacter sp. W3I1]MDQ0638164.1 hypothetical protein [Pedobacter sp. W3I1]
MHISRQVRAIDIKSTILDTTKTSISVSNFLTKEIYITTTTEKVAILSWKWDISSNNESKNLLLALVYSQEIGIEYLLVDLVSVDQNLNSFELMEEVIAFSNLYKVLPVIATYDWECENWLWTMRRPWICYEIHNYTKNSNTITYLGHTKGQGCEDSFGFAHMINRIANSTFAQTILYLLLDKVKITKLDDLKYLLPNYSRILEAAYEKLSQNDYILTAVILAQNDISDKEEHYPYIKYRVNGDQDILYLTFSNYSFLEEGSSTHRLRYSIMLGDTKVATWHNYENNAGDSRLFLEPVAGIKKIISKFLNIDASIDDCTQLSIKSYDTKTPKFETKFFKLC